MSVRERTYEVGDYVRVRHHGKLLPGIYELKVAEPTDKGDTLLTVQRLGRATPRFLSSKETELKLVQRSRRAS